MGSSAAYTPVRKIARRTRGTAQGLVTRLMSPSDFGEILKPFVFLDLFDHQGAPFNGGLHPHSGIATLTWIAEGAVSFTGIDVRAATEDQMRDLFAKDTNN